MAENQAIESKTDEQAEKTLDLFIDIALLSAAGLLPPQELNTENEEINIIRES